MTEPKVTINLVVYNGEKYIRHCLNAVKAQSYQNIQVNILDNSSTDRTRGIVKTDFPEFNLIESSSNLGMWWGQEEALKHTDGEYIIALSVDIMLHPDFVKNAVARCQQDPSIGAIQAKIFQYNFSDLEQGTYAHSRTIDTLGFKIYKSRRVLNRGHGQEDKPEFNHAQEIFAVEGAVPFFRRQALEDSRLDGYIVDRDYKLGSIGHGDDLDLAWRMRLYGFKQFYDPTVIAYHDRKTTKSASQNNLFSYLRRVKIRQQVPLAVRRLEWANIRFTLIKNDDIILQDLPLILSRELMVFGYTLLFEPAVFLEIGRFLSLLPKMIRKRADIQKRRRASVKDMQHWFI